jgi:hypothetical protein
MSTDRTKLALRRHTIRRLTSSELNVARGGFINTKNPSSNCSRTANIYAVA